MKKLKIVKYPYLPAVSVCVTIVKTYILMYIYQLMPIDDRKEGNP